MPAPRSYQKIKEEMLKKVESGEYLLGELVAPKEMTKLVLTNDGEIKKVKFVISARRIPMNQIRKRIYEEHKLLGMNNFFPSAAAFFNFPLFAFMLPLYRLFLLTSNYFVIVA